MVSLAGHTLMGDVVLDGKVGRADTSESCDVEDGSIDTVEVVGNRRD